jgi:hypothetical protein
MKKEEKIIWSLNKDNTSKPLQIKTTPLKKSFSERHKTLSYLLVGLVFSLGFGFLILPTETSVDTCFTSSFCINSLENPVLFGLYLGAVVFGVLLIIVLLYEYIVKLSRKQNHLTIFSLLFLTVAILSISLWYFGNDELARERTKMLPVFTTLVSLSGILLVQFRKNK